MIYIHNMIYKTKTDTSKLDKKNKKKEKWQREGRRITKPVVFTFRNPIKQ